MNLRPTQKPLIFEQTIPFESIDFQQIQSTERKNIDSKFDYSLFKDKNLGKLVPDLFNSRSDQKFSSPMNTETQNSGNLVEQSNKQQTQMISRSIQVDLEKSRKQKQQFNIDFLQSFIQDDYTLMDLHYRNCQIKLHEFNQSEQNQISKFNYLDQITDNDISQNSKQEIRNKTFVQDERSYMEAYNFSIDTSPQNVIQQKINHYFNQVALKPLSDKLINQLKSRDYSNYSTNPNNIEVNKSQSPSKKSLTPRTPSKKQLIPKSPSQKSLTPRNLNPNLKIQQSFQFKQKQNLENKSPEQIKRDPNINKDQSKFYTANKKQINQSTKNLQQKQATNKSKSEIKNQKIKQNYFSNNNNDCNLIKQQQQQQQYQQQQQQQQQLLLQQKNNIMRKQNTPINTKQGNQKQKLFSNQEPQYLLLDLSKQKIKNNKNVNLSQNQSDKNQVQEQVLKIQLTLEDLIQNI